MGTYTGQDKRLQYLFQNGGGGGGSNVIPNPQGDATDELEKLQIENTIYGLPTEIGAVGLFIDTNNVIKASTSIPANTDVKYTATQDCCVRYSLISNANNQSSIKIDGVSINSTYIPSQLPLITLGGVVYLKKGQEIVLRQSYTQANGSYVVYGLLRGSEGGVYLPACYSTEERQVGCWKDGKPLYQKTIDFGALPANTTKNVNHNISNLDIIVDIRATATRPASQGTYTTIPIPYTHWENISNQNEISINDTTIMIRNHNANASAFSKVYVTVRYTKTTDTAGSGIWTPSGAQAIHYSTEEQILGTYLGKTLYCKVINFSSPVVCNPQQWATTEVPTSSLNVETLVNSVCTYDGVNYPCAVSCDTNDAYVSILNVRNVTLSVKTLIIQYTKNT